MTYETWIKTHELKHKNIMAKLQGYKKEEILKYFVFENMQKKEPDFCLLYQTNTKCHDIKYLNCYMCACPHFRLEETKSYCSINSKDGGTFVDKKGFSHQDCSACTIPHKEKYISNNYDESWKKIMKDVLKK